MQVILTQNVASLGKIGEMKNVADGYAINFLLPKKLAVVANQENIQKQQAVMAENKKREIQLSEELKKSARAISGMELTIQSKSKDGKLFGSIGAKHIKNALEKKGVSVNLNQIVIPEPIRTEGKRTVTIRLNKNIEAKIFLGIEGI